MRLLLPLFILLPIIEMYLLIEVGGFIGAVPTIALVFLTAIIGVQMLRLQGLSTLMRAQQKMAEGTLPAQEILEGLLLAVGGVLLLMPGFFTDVMGALCLLPFARRALARQLLRRGVFAVPVAMSQAYADNIKPQADGEVFEGQFSREGQSRIDINEK